MVRWLITALLATCGAHRAPDGATCRGDDDCERGHCFCTGALARPNPQHDAALRAVDGTAATGRCSVQRLPDGYWFCLVERGTVHLNGIIVD